MVRKWLSERNNNIQIKRSFILINELQITDPFQLNTFLRMDYNTFLYIATKIGLIISKKDTNYRLSIVICKFIKM